MKKYLAYDGINGDFQEFETIEDAQKFLKEIFFDSDEGYHPDMKSCKIFELKQTVDYRVVDSKVNYKTGYEDDFCDDDEIWPYNDDFDEIWEHEFVSVP